MIKYVRFKDFTAFADLHVDLSPGINVFVGANGTGKTHILKTVYAACDITRAKTNFAEKMTRVFMPFNWQTGRLVRRQRVSASGLVEVGREFRRTGQDAKLTLRFSNHTDKPENALIRGVAKWLTESIGSVYIPVKEMLANAPGFRSLYSQRSVHFEEVYADIVDRALLPMLRGPADRGRRMVLASLQKAMEGKVVVRNEDFFLKNRLGNLEFSLLAEGLRKIGLLWVLVQNGTLLSGSVLCWDEPESNLNPKLMKSMVEILLSLQRMGVQILVATHDYVCLKELDLQKSTTDKVVFHSLYRDQASNNIAITSTPNYLQINPNAIADTFADLFDRDMGRALNAEGRR